SVILGYATGYALTRRSLPVGGAGAVEALLPLSLLWVAVPLAPAVLAVLFSRVINLWLPLIPALAGFRSVRRRHLRRGSARRRATVLAPGLMAAATGTTPWRRGRGACT